MLWVLKRTVSMRRFFEHPKRMFKLMGKKKLQFYAQKISLTGLYLYSWNIYLSHCMDIDGINTKIYYE